MIVIDMIAMAVVKRVRGRHAQGLCSRIFWRPRTSTALPLSIAAAAVPSLDFSSIVAAPSRDSRGVWLQAQAIGEVEK